MSKTRLLIFVSSLALAVLSLSPVSAASGAKESFEITVKFKGRDGAEKTALLRFDGASCKGRNGSQETKLAKRACEDLLKTHEGLFHGQPKDHAPVSPDEPSFDVSLTSAASTWSTSVSQLSALDPDGESLRSLARSVLKACL